MCRMSNFGHFLSLGGGTMSLAKYQHVNGFRAGSYIHEKFHVYWTLCSKVISISFFLARCSKWRPSHAHTVTPIQKILITFDPKGVKTVHSDFHENPTKSLGGVR